MVRINFEISEYDYERFKSKVGKGNVSACIRNFIKHSINDPKDNTQIHILRKKYEFISKQKDKTDFEFNKIKQRIDEIEDKTKQDEIIRLEKQQKLKDKIKKIKGRTLRENLSEIVG